jgi:hypothetical protein
MSLRSTPQAYTYSSSARRSSSAAGTPPTELVHTSSSSRPYPPLHSRSSQSNVHQIQSSSNIRKMSRQASFAATQTGTATSTPRRNMKGLTDSTTGQRTTPQQGDWANMEADEVFRRLGVSEVRKVESKMRAEALGKQSELRSMVGCVLIGFQVDYLADGDDRTRYRDLLTSATQITSLRSSSLRLSQNLRSVAQACSDPSVAVNTEEVESDNEGDDTVVMLPVAAHMKLLLDAPEGRQNDTSSGESR